MLRQDANNVGAAGVESADLVGSNIEASDLESFTTEQQGQGQTDVSHANDPNLGLAVGYFAGMNPRRQFGSCGHDVDCKGATQTNPMRR